MPYFAVVSSKLFAKFAVVSKTLARRGATMAAQRTKVIYMIDITTLLYAKLGLKACAWLNPELDKVKDTRVERECAG